MRFAHLVLALPLVLLLSLHAFAQTPAPAVTAESDPGSPGFSASWLARIAPWYQAQIGASLSAGDRQSVARSIFAGTGLNVTKAEGRVALDPVAGGPAEQAGVMKGDLLTAVDGVTTGALSLGEIIGKLRCKVGTVTTLTLLRAGSVTPLTILVERGTTTLPGAELTIRLGR
jgi:hypothetical protein